MNQETSVLPVDFDGVFRFTNWTDRDFVAKWGGKEYKFPALKTTPMIMGDFTPYEIQNIRKKFAKDLANREFFQSKEHDALNAKNTNLTSFHGAVTYTDNDLKVFIQKCLDPLPVGKVEVTTPISDGKKRTFHTDEDGKPTTRVLKSKLAGDAKDDSLIAEGTKVE